MSKRGRDVAFGDGDASRDDDDRERVIVRKDPSLDRPLTNEEMDALLDAAPMLPQITAAAVRKLILVLETALTKNLEMRQRHASNPDAVSAASWTWHCVHVLLMAL